MKRIRFAIVLMAIVIVFSMVASAAPLIMGSVNLGSPVANVKVPNLNSATFVGVPSFTVISPATGTFAGSFGMTGTATSFVGNAPVAGLLTFDGFTIDVTSFLGGPNVWSKVTLGPTDILGFSFTGVAHKAGYDDTNVIGSVTTQYPGGYQSWMTTSWSATIQSTAQPTPEPGTYALMGVGLASLAFLRRKKA